MIFRLVCLSLRNSRLSFSRKFRKNIHAWKDLTDLPRTNEIIKDELITKNTHACKDLTDLRQSNQIVKDEPIKYSTSEAAKWKAIYSTSGKRYYEIPRIQPMIVVFSLTAFMVYFCILREENDLDDWLRQLEKTVPYQVEEAQLHAEIEIGKRKGINITHLQSRLEKVENMKETVKNNSVM